MSIPDEMRKLYTVEEVAEVLQVSPYSVRQYLKDGVLRGGKIGNSWRVTHASLNEYIEARFGGKTSS